MPTGLRDTSHVEVEVEDFDFDFDFDFNMIQKAPIGIVRGAVYNGPQENPSQSRL